MEPYQSRRHSQTLSRRRSTRSGTTNSTRRPSSINTLIRPANDIFFLDSHSRVQDATDTLDTWTQDWTADTVEDRNYEADDSDFTLNDSEQEYQPHVESGNAHAGNLDFSIPSPLRTRAPRPFLGGGPTLEETQDNSVGRPMISGSIHSSTADTVVPILHPNESGSLSQLRVGSRLEDDELMWEEGQNFTAGSAEEDIPLGTSGRPRKGSYLPIPHTREVKRKGFETFTDDDSEPAQSPDNDSSFNERWEKVKAKGSSKFSHG
ncbi:hypothetical protein M231_03954 [Tremella mesenterica]|uniref:Uncharacterized protein n=1 Tax=Tremella mesenterica TaxID=5217 RepID=A0A4Q1BLU8_TREME|nr:hypothetical protein M231_03954 [Tremella mesenterica]